MSERLWNVCGTFLLYCFDITKVETRRRQEQRGVRARRIHILRLPDLNQLILIEIPQQRALDTVVRE
jgi:hypothetical protein